jgi:hypothetical protein
LIARVSACSSKSRPCESRPRRRTLICISTRWLLRREAAFDGLPGSCWDMAYSLILTIPQGAGGANPLLAKSKQKKQHATHETLYPAKYFFRNYGRCSIGL